MTSLGETAPLPVEIVAFGWETTLARVAGIGVSPALRRQADGQPFRTDGGNLILDCHCGSIPDPRSLQDTLSKIIGVVETGLFVGMATTALVATANGVVRLDRPA